LQEPQLAAAKARLGGWKSLCARLRSAAGVKLPDLNVLMTEHAQISTALVTAQVRLRQSAASLFNARINPLQLLPALHPVY